MAERSGGVYKKWERRANTRTSKRVPRKSYVKGVPRPKISHFEAGDGKKEFAKEISLIADSRVQIKHNALEAARITVNKALSGLSVNDYFFKIRVYPHHILRENSMATGAGADRFQSGMSRAFGKPVGVAARVKRGQKILSVYTSEGRVDNAKEAMRRARMKFPVQCRVLIEDSTRIIGE